MPVSKSGKKTKKKSAKASSASQLDIVFSGPLLFVPSVSAGNITNVEVYFPRNGHPAGAVFLPGVLFSDAELEQPEPEGWPEPTSFSLLDPHSYAIHLAQAGEIAPFPVASIPRANHKVKPGRKLSGDWEIAIGIEGKLSRWSTHRPIEVTKNIYYGSDAPTTATVSVTQRLSFANVIGAEFCGASPEPAKYFRASGSGGGTLIFAGEIPYQSTLLHERQAIDALARLAGLNLHLTASAPIPSRTRLMDHVAPCRHSIIVA